MLLITTVVLAVLGGWLLVSVLLALAIGRAIRIADRRDRAAMAYRAAVRTARTADRPTKLIARV